jgi:hypothetical protein
LFVYITETNRLPRKAMMPAMSRSIFTATLAPIWERIVRSPVGKRTLGEWTTMILARVKDLAPYAVIELLLPGGSVVALSLWLYRRRKRPPALARAVNA